MWPDAPACSLATKIISHYREKWGARQAAKEAAVLPMSKRAQSLLGHYFAIHNKWAVGTRQAQKIVKQVANRDHLAQTVTPHILRLYMGRDTSFSLKFKPWPKVASLRFSLIAWVVFECSYFISLNSSLLIPNSNSA